MAETIDLASLTPVGRELSRPECVLATSSGTVFVCDWRGGIVKIAPDGSQSFIGTQHAPGDGPLRPNGIALLNDGSFLAANLADSGGVWRIKADGDTRPWLTEADGQWIPPANFVSVDTQGRTWITVSSRLKDRTQANHARADDGFIILSDTKGARIVGDGFCFTNEALVDPTGKWLYVNETFGRRLSRLPIQDDGSLGKRETVTEFGEGNFPDGMAFDTEGAVWVAMVISNRLVRVMPDGSQQVVLEDPDPRMAEMERDYKNGTFGAAKHLTYSRGAVIANLSSLAFGGPDLKTVWLGNLNGDRILRFRSPIAGRKPVHWDWA